VGFVVCRVCVLAGTLEDKWLNNNITSDELINFVSIAAFLSCVCMRYEIYIMKCNQSHVAVIAYEV
jgi:hypothetical protein